jgi:hypothetical protein
MAIRIKIMARTTTYVGVGKDNKIARLITNKNWYVALA